MTREQYEKDKAAKVAAGKKVIDLTQPKSELPSMFREEISVYEIKKDSLWVNPKGQTVGFGGVWDPTARDHVNKAVLLTPAFTQLVATGAGVTAAGEPEIEKHKAMFEITMPSGITRKVQYTCRVVGRISFKRLTPSGNPEVKYYTTEVDVDGLLNKAVADDLEKIGTYDKYDKGPDGKALLYTEENIRFSTSDEAHNSLEKFKKLNELSQHAYQKVDTKLRSHGAEKFIGIPGITENMVGGFIYVSRISYNTDDPKIRQALAIGAVQDILGIRAPSRLIENTTEDVASESEEIINVTTEPLGDDIDDIPAEEPVVDTATVAAESTASPTEEACMKIIEWLNSGLISDQSVFDYLDAISSKNLGVKITAPALAGITLLSKGTENEKAAYDMFMNSAKEVYFGNEKVIKYIEDVSANYSRASANGVLVKATIKVKEM